jgi:hypothetical protein
MLNIIGLVIVWAIIVTGLIYVSISCGGPSNGGDFHRFR